MDFAAGERGKKKMDELKKCPFCGGKAALLANNDVKVSCLRCAAQTNHQIDFMIRTGRCTNAVQRVVDAWNRRADNG